MKQSICAYYMHSCTGQSSPVNLTQCTLFAALLDVISQPARRETMHTHTHIHRHCRTCERSLPDNMLTHQGSRLTKSDLMFARTPHPVDCQHILPVRLFVDPGLSTRSHIALNQPAVNARSGIGQHIQPTLPHMITLQTTSSMLN